MWVVVVLVVAAGCGRVGFEARAIDADGGGTVEPPPGPLLGPPLTIVDPSLLPGFGAPQLVPGLSLAGVEDDDPCLTRDQLEIFFDRVDPGPDHAIYTSRRALITDPWPTPTRIDAINTGDDEEQPQVSGDGLRLYFASNNDLYVTSRATRDSAWGDVRRIDELSSVEDDDMGGLSADDQVLVFSSKRGGKVSDDLYEARRTDTATPWSAPVLLATLEVNTYERSAHVDDTGLVMYFDRGGAPNLYWTQRAALDAPWAPAMQVTELDLGDEQTDPWLSPDLRTIYFVRASTSGDTKDIYVATR